MNKKKILKEILKKLEYPKIHFYKDFINMKQQKIKMIFGNVIWVGVNFKFIKSVNTNK